MIQSLFVSNFRNFKTLQVDKFSEKVNIFLGDNGQGKSNLLEAIYVLISGQSFRYADNSNLILNGTQESYLKAKALTGDYDFDLELNILKSKKTHLVNKKRATAGELSKRFPSVIFSPESLSAIKEASDQRRQLVDDLIVSIDSKNADLISEFRKALRTRNRILKNFAAGEVNKNQTEDLLESLNPSYLRLAIKLTSERLKSIRAIQPEFNLAMKNITKKNVDILVEYVISGENGINFSDSEIQNSMQNRLKQLHDAELSSGASLVGPQKHDLTFLYDGNDSRFYCSQGQQRALILSFKMAQIVYHRRIHESYPILLLDDVLSELDSEKRDALIKFLSEINTQIFITTTDFNLPSSMKSEDCAVIKIRDGTIGY